MSCCVQTLKTPNPDLAAWHVARFLTALARKTPRPSLAHRSTRAPSFFTRKEHQEVEQGAHNPPPNDQFLLDFPKQKRKNHWHPLLSMSILRLSCSFDVRTMLTSENTRALCFFPCPSPLAASRVLQPSGVPRSSPSSSRSAQLSAVSGQR